MKGVLKKSLHKQSKRCYAAYPIKQSAAIMILKKTLSSR